MIIQSIALLDQLDKDINTFAMRVREWYSWHFPELKEIVKDNLTFARTASYIKVSFFPTNNQIIESNACYSMQDKSKLTEDQLPGLVEIVGEEDQAKAIYKASKASMGMDTSEQDMNNIIIFTDRMVSLALYRKQLYSYLEEKMSTVAPNLSTLIGLLTVSINVFNALTCISNLSAVISNCICLIR